MSYSLHFAQIQFKSQIPENWDKIKLNSFYSQIATKLNLKQYLPENWAIFHQISTKIDEKWDKNKNNGFGLRPQKLNENQLKIK